MSVAVAMEISNSKSEGSESDLSLRVAGSESDLEGSFIDDGGQQFVKNAVGTYSNHGIEITGDEEARAAPTDGRGGSSLLTIRLPRAGPKNQSGPRQH